MYPWWAGPIENHSPWIQVVVTWKPLGPFTPVTSPKNAGGMAAPEEGEVQTSSIESDGVEWKISAEEAL